LVVHSGRKKRISIPINSVDLYDANALFALTRASVLVYRQLSLWTVFLMASSLLV
jgi:hypothetical protein